MSPETGTQSRKAAGTEAAMDTVDQSATLKDMIKLGAFALGTAAALGLVHYREKKAGQQG